MKIGIKIIWSGCRLLPPAKPNNRYKNYRYRYCLYIKFK